MSVVLSDIDPDALAVAEGSVKEAGPGGAATLAYAADVADDGDEQPLPPPSSLWPSLSSSLSCSPLRLFRPSLSIEGDR